MQKRSVFIGLLLFTATACSAEWIIPEGYIVECTDNSDCPDTAECTLTDDGTSLVCVTAGETWCGNGVQEVGEACDDGDTDNSDYCSSDCLSVTTICGDAKTEGQEACDHVGQINGWYCNEECLTFRKECGDSVVAVFSDGRDGEVCDQGSQNTDDYQLNKTCL
ncbi:MAG: hypothetical protein HOI23_09715, partial [Deltaproteobacteria bacterium]|nr:hypothetical protein [Deltaproteobacteria bacterium]